MHHPLLQEIFVEDLGQLVHQDLSQLHPFGNHSAVFQGEQARDEAGDGQISQFISQVAWLAEVQDLGDGGKALAAHLCSRGSSDEEWRVGVC